MPNEFEIDAALDAQADIRDAVRSLPEESLSLQWRSELNERLRAQAPKVRRSVWLSHAWKPAMGLMAAGCLATMVTFRMAIEEPTVSSANRGELEASLVGAFRESASARELAGTGVPIVEFRETSPSYTSDWSDADLEAL